MRPRPNAAVEADDIAVGFTAGVLWSPNAGHHRSVSASARPSITIWRARLAIAGVPVGSAGVTANVKTPETVTLSLRQALTPSTDGPGVRRVGQLEPPAEPGRLLYINQRRAGLLRCGSACGSRLVLGWHDSWFYSAGLEYAMNPAAHAADRPCLGKVADPEPR